MAIVSFPHSNGTKPHVIMDEDLEEIARFDCPHDIELLATTHILTAGDWFALNFVTGQFVRLG